MEIFQNDNNSRSGFSFIEILIFITILSLFFIMALTITVFSLRNLKQSEHKIVAIHYSNQLKEWLTYEKEKDWEGLISKNASSYCFNEENLSWPIEGSCLSTCPGGLNCLDDMYNRQALFTNNGNGSNTVDISVSWIEIDKPITITNKIIFSVWEK